MNAINFCIIYVKLVYYRYIFAMSLCRIIVYFVFHCILICCFCNLSLIKFCSVLFCSVKLIMSIWFFCSLDIVKRVKAKEIPPYRPTSSITDIEETVENEWKIDNKTKEMMIHLLHDCWSDESQCRPSMSDIKIITRKLNQGKYAKFISSFSYT